MRAARAMTLSFALLLAACAGPESAENVGADAAPDDQALIAHGDDAELAPDVGAAVEDPPDEQVACGLRFRIGYLGLGWYWGNCTNRYQYVVWKRLGPDKGFCVKPQSYKFVTGITLKPNVVLIANRCP